jgi:hypothetical protein
MIAILFPAGAFGSTLEYCVRNFSNELTKVNARVQADGSMHGFTKEFHPTTFEQYMYNVGPKHEVITPIYPTLNYTSPVESILHWKNILPKEARTIVIYFDGIEQYERNTLFAFSKIPNYLQLALKDKAQAWNSAYQSHNDMTIWELREALSFLVCQSNDYVNIDQHVPNNFMKITPDDILFRLPTTLKNILTFCDLTYNDDKLADFYLNWQKKQQYVLNEFKLINEIDSSIKSNRNFSWNKLSIMGEAIIQSRLRRQGVELKCFNLINFPTNTTQLATYFK